jgi:nitroreductase
MTIVSPIDQRRALRAIDVKPISQEILLRLAQAAHFAPSCANAQPWRLITVVDSLRLQELKSALTPGNYWAKNSPAITAFVADLEWDARMDGGRDYAFFDLGQAAMNYQVQATSEGLIAHPIAGFDQVAAKRALCVPQTAVLMTLVVLGFPGDTSHLNERHQAAEKSPRVRKPLEDVFSFDTWEQRLEPPAKTKN